MATATRRRRGERHRLEPHGRAGGFRELCEGPDRLRKSIKNLHLSSYDDIAKNMTVLQQSDGVVAYQLKDGSDTYVVVFNANESAATVEAVPAGKYTVLAADGKVTQTQDKNAATTVGADGYQAGALAAAVLKAGATMIRPSPMEARTIPPSRATTTARTITSRASQPPPGTPGVVATAMVRPVTATPPTAHPTPRPANPSSSALPLCPTPA